MLIDHLPRTFIIKLSKLATLRVWDDCPQVLNWSYNNQRLNFGLIEGSQIIFKEHWTVILF